MRHPLDVRYAPAWLTRRDLRPMIPAAIVLADGRITCTSCHDGASPYRRKIAVPPGELCTSCHLR
jgi:predicted CXXCH cytochrome family protein